MHLLCCAGSFSKLELLSGMVCFNPKIGCILFIKNFSKILENNTILLILKWACQSWILFLFFAPGHSGALLCNWALSFCFKIGRRHRCQSLLSCNFLFTKLVICLPCKRVVRLLIEIPRRITLAKNSCFTCYVMWSEWIRRHQLWKYVWGLYSPVKKKKYSMLYLQYKCLPFGDISPAI